MLGGADASMETPRYGIFLSSTNDPEVRNYRLAAKRVIESEEFRDQWYAVEMDDFDPHTSESLKRCRELVLCCRLYIGLLGPFYGTEHATANLSFTEYEYTVARAHKLGIAVFLLPDSIVSTSPPDLVIRQGPLMPRQLEFKDRVNSLHTTRQVISIADFEARLRQYLRNPELPQHCPALTREDWGSAPDVTTFFGRTDELGTLTQWAVAESCRLISIIGMGGIGKTDLTLKVAREINEEFEYIIWRTLLNAPSIMEILGDLIKFVSDHQEVKLPDSPSGRISRLMSYLQEHRCLLILDNVESILRGGAQSGMYQDGYDAYGELLRQAGSIRHQSCLLINSREKPLDISQLESKTGPVRTLELKGLGDKDGRKIFGEIGAFEGSDREWTELIEIYNGNPLALELVAKHIIEVYFGNISLFLREGRPLFHDLNDLLAWHFLRLSDLEKEVMYWLAIDREPVFLHELEEDVLTTLSRRLLPSTLQSLQRRMPLEKRTSRFTLQPVLIEYVTDRLVEQAVDEVLTGKIAILDNHALLKALTTDSVRETQTRLIVWPIRDRLLTRFTSQGELEAQLERMTLSIRARGDRRAGYAAGNILNLWCQLKSELHENDFSRLALWQAYLQSVRLYNVNFADSDLKNCVFRQTFGPISSHAFSPDGHLLAASESNGSINIWRVGDFQIHLSLKGHISWIFALAFSPDGQTLASGGEDKTVRLWDIKTGSCLRILEGHTNSIWAVAFSPDGSLLASGAEDKAICVWDLASGNLVATLRDHSHKVFALDFSPDGRMLVSGSEDRSIKFWKVGDWKHAVTLEGHGDTVRGVAFSPDGRLLASGSWDQTVKVWNVSSRECVKALPAQGASVHSVAFAPSSRVLASSDEEGTIRIWDIDSGRCMETLQGHVGEVWKVTFTRDGRWLASGGHDGVLRVWETENWACRHTMHGYIDWVQALALSPDGNLAAASIGDMTIRVWDIGSGRCIETLRPHTGWAFGVAFSPDGRKFASGSDDRRIKIWDAQTWTCTHVLQGHANWVQTVAFSPDNRFLASGSDDRTAKLWDVQSGKCVRTFQGHADGIWSVDFSPSGEWLASASEDRTIRLWRVQGGQCLRTYQGHADRVHSVKFSPDGRWLVSCSDDKMVGIWNVESAKCLLMLEGHTSWVMSVSMSPDGRLVCSGGKDGTVRIWELQPDRWSWLRPGLVGKCLRVLQGHSAGVWLVTFVRNGKTVASASEDGSIRIWDVDSGECVRTLRQLKPYEGLNIAGVTGLTEAQRVSLRVLGAVERRPVDSGS